jgi:hypothetical protein
MCAALSALPPTTGRHALHFDNETSCKEDTDAQITRFFRCRLCLGDGSVLGDDVDFTTNV